MALIRSRLAENRKAVLPSRQERKLNLHEHFIENRKRELAQVALLCKLFNKKVRIDFHTSNGESSIETSVFFSTKENLIMQDGRIIPIVDVIDIRTKEDAY